MGFNLGDLLQLIIGSATEVAAPGNPIGLGMMGSGAGGMLGGNSGQALGGMLGGVTGGANSLFNPASAAMGNSSGIENLLKALAPIMGGGAQSKPTPQQLGATPQMGIMQPKPFQPPAPQALSTTNQGPGIGGSNNQLQKALMALIMQGNGGGMI